MSDISFLKAGSGSSLEFDMEEIKRIEPSDIEKMSDKEIKILLFYLIKEKQGVISTDIPCRPKALDAPQRDLCEEVWRMWSAPTIEDPDRDKL